MATGGWAIDLGTTNSALARWDDAAGQAKLVVLPSVCRDPHGDDPLAAPRLVPSAIDFLDRPGLLDRIGAWPPLERTALFGRLAVIGRPALARNQGSMRPSFVPAWKPGLSTEPLRPLARVGDRTIDARQAAHRFLRELLRETKRATGARIRELVATTPVAIFEGYRAELRAIFEVLGIAKARFLDEPVAAALGYGLNLAEQREALVVDIGGGTMHVALVRFSPRRALEGEAIVLGKRGHALGGNAVDGWVLEALCRDIGYDLGRDDGDEVTRLWRRFLLSEARRVKEEVFFAEEAEFLIDPPGRTGSRSVPAKLRRERLSALLEEQGFLRRLGASIDEVLADNGMKEGDVEDVLLVGGSTLLPGVYPRIEERFGRSRVRAWQPFEAVVHGAATFAGGRIAARDFIVHDYAFVTHDAATGAREHTVVVPRGTRFPTAADLWKRELVPTCALGEPETIFKLLVCEVARFDGAGAAGGPADRRFVWDATGRLHRLGGAEGEAELAVPLNAANPTLGVLDPPHEPGDRRPRLEIAFGVNAERWLIATVRDLLTGRRLLDEEPVVRLV
jgi:molecular chaperone DnaK (HSP70)